jgi:GNAT superfamily N-acetyltransferase
VTGVELVLSRERFDAQVVQALLAALDAELDARYADEGIDPPVHDPRDYESPRGVLLVARLGGEPVGCGALRPGPAEGVGEVKRMYVAPAVRGRRVAERLLAELLEAARRLGYRRLVLETGTEQPEALRLYQRLGWTPVPAFGHYRDSPLSRCYGLDLG